MQYPQESLDDFTVKPAPEPELNTEPPPPVWLRFTGEVEVVKPLTSPVAGDTPLRAASNRVVWFHRSLAVGGAFAMIALIFASAFIIGINEPPADSGRDLADNINGPDDIAIDQKSIDMPLPTDEPLTSDTSSPQTFAGRRGVRSNARRISPKPSVRSAAYRPRRQQPRPPQVVSKFVATTLVIYMENGEIKTRVEPQKPQTF